MNDKVQAEIQQITENYNMGFFTSFEALMQTYDALMHAAEEIEDEEKRDEYYAKISKAFNNEHMENAWRELSLDSLNA